MGKRYIVELSEDNSESHVGLKLFCAIIVVVVLAMMGIIK